MFTGKVGFSVFASDPIIFDQQVENCEIEKPGTGRSVDFFAELAGPVTQPCSETALMTFPPPDDVIFHYSQVPVEQSFRMTKSDLKIRPSFHFRIRRIESHVLLCMISLCVMRILDQKVKPYDYTYREAIEIIEKTDSAIIGNRRKTHLIPPIYSEDFKAITAALDIS